MYVGGSVLGVSGCISGGCEWLSDGWIRSVYTVLLVIVMIDEFISDWSFGGYDQW